MNSKMILIYLEEVSNCNLSINLLNHILPFALIIVFLLELLKKKQGRPINHKIVQILANVTVVELALSVTINAAVYGSSFHLITFALMSILFVVFCFETKKKRNDSGVRKVEVGISAFSVISVLILLLGLWYPEFVHTDMMRSFVFAPVGIVPCPTLLTILGVMNLFGTLFSRRKKILVVVFAIIYGIVGTFVFGVYLDIALLVAVIFTIYGIVRENNVN